MIKFSVHAKDVNVMDATPDFMQSLFFNCPKLLIEMWDHPCMYMRIGISNLCPTLPISFRCFSCLPLHPASPFRISHSAHQANCLRCHLNVHHCPICCHSFRDRTYRHDLIVAHIQPRRASKQKNPSIPVSTCTLITHQKAHPKTAPLALSQ